VQPEPLPESWQLSSLPQPWRHATRTDGFDVVVVGGGGSGLAAAIAAAESGATVAVLEKAPYLRGSTGRSIGSIAASRTLDQRKLGITDSPQEHAEDYLKIAGEYADREDVELVRLLTEEVTEAYNWLRSLGMEFFGPVPDPEHRYPRLHNILPTSQSYIHHLTKRARAVGVRIFLGTGGDELVQDGGRVVGVRAVDATGAAPTFRARHGVVLAPATSPTARS
jgi:succinate dehydrogenase/fumarate reductase flavoprotein subunit